MHIWTTSQILAEGQQSLYIYEINKEFSDILVAISDDEKFPLISELSYVDFDLYSGESLDKLINEFEDLKTIYLNYSNEITTIIKVLREALTINEKILFDPFRHSINPLTIFNFS